MKLTALAALFVTTILLTGAVSTSMSVQYADAAKGQGVSVSSYGSKTKGMVCGDRLCSEIPGGRAAWEEQQGTSSVVIPRYGLEQKGMSLPPETVFEKRAQGEICQCGADGCNCPGCTCSQDGICTCHGDAHKCSCGGHTGTSGTCVGCGMMGYGYHGMKGHEMKSVSGTAMSETDPGRGHEQHQLAVLLPPSSDTYTGILTYSASENVQLVALHGPLTEDEVRGQTTWTPDGKTKFALTLVDQQNKMGTWMFTGNALAVHSFSTDPFAVTYSIVTMGGGESVSVHEKRSHGMTCQCAEGCSCDQSGACICSGEVGSCMCGPNCNCGQ